MTRSYSIRLSESEVRTAILKHLSSHGEPIPADACVQVGERILSDTNATSALIEWSVVVDSTPTEGPFR